MMLWANLDILEGSLYNGLVEDGYKFLDVDLPFSHPVERDYDWLGLIVRDNMSLGYLINQMQIPFDIRQIMDEAELKQLAKDLSGMDEAKRANFSFNRVMGKIRSDKRIMEFVFNSTPDEKWDANIGFYKTYQAIGAEYFSRMR